METTKFIRLGLVLSFLGDIGCHSEKFDNEVVIYPSERFAYEIRLHSHSNGRGNPHDVFDFSKYEWEADYSICVNRLKGKIEAADMIFTQMPGCKPHPSFWVDQRGFIEFVDGSVTVSLEAIYDKEIGSKPSPLAANGNYKIARVMDKPFTPTPISKG